MSTDPMKDAMAAAKSSAAVPAKPAAPVAPAKPALPTIGNVAATIKPAAHRQAVNKPKPVKDEMTADVGFRVAFMGTGQGGGRMANAFYNLGYRRVAAFNTTDQDFADLDVKMPKHSLDVGGAAKDTRLAAEAMKGRDQEVWDLMTRAWGSDLDCAIICVGLGGGTGSGTVAQLVNLARKYMIDHGSSPRVGALVSLPTTTEGYAVCRNAVLGFRELIQLNVSPLIIVDNARIHELYAPPMTTLHSTANSVVASLFHLFNQLSAVHSKFITFDRSELGQILDSGLVVFGGADLQKFESPADITTAIRDQLANSVLAQVDLTKGRKAACLFVGHQSVLDTLDLSYFDAGFGQLDRMLGDGSIVHRGVYMGSDAGLQVYTAIGELSLPKERLAQLARKGGLNGGAGDTSSVAAWLGVDG